VAAADGHHIAIYLGNGKMIEAPHTGAFVRISPVRKGMVGIKLSLAGGGGMSAPSIDTSATGTPDAMDQGLSLAQGLDSVGAGAIENYAGI
jgi:cell wall-associated NlpC family hydrolase